MSWRLKAFGAALVLLTLVAARSESSSADATGALVRRKRGELDPQTCAEDFDIQRDKIIRTEESREMGAKYLNELDIGSREECLRLCCETDACDVFVFEEKSPGSCYLFTCGPPEDFKCKFTRHTNFSSGVLAVSRRAAELHDMVRLSKHEHDLASLRNPTVATASTTTTTPTTPSTTTAAPEKHSSPPAKRRCSPYQFSCHGSGECIAIYNACDGVPQCADASDEAPELGCPTPPALPAPVPRPPPNQLASQKAYGPEAVSPFLREPGSEYSAPAHWPHRLVQAQPAKHSEESGMSSHIFNHKGSLLQENDSPVGQQYVPIEAMSEAQWPRRPWQQPSPVDQMSMSDRQLMYRYGEQTGWKPPAGEPPRPARPDPRAPDADKMWPVPRTSVDKPELYPVMAGKTMPEAPMIYMNQEGSLRDGPKKGFDLRPHNENPYVNDPAYIVAKQPIPDEGTMAKETNVITNKVPDVKIKNEDSKTAHVKTNDAATTKVREENKHDMKHEHYKMPDDDHDGVNEKPAGAILLLILGVLMTSVMAVMLVCRLRAARRRMRRGGKSPFAHDADYLVNGMYL